MAPHLLKKTTPITYGKVGFSKYLRRCPTPSTEGIPKGHELIVFQNATKDIPMLAENMFHGAPNHGSFLKLTKEMAMDIYRMAL